MKGAKGQTCLFSVTGLLNSKHLTQEQLLLEAPAQDDVARWMKTINDTMQQSMGREFGREFICGLKVLRIHMDGASMEVSAVISNAVCCVRYPPRMLGCVSNIYPHGYYVIEY
jgi:hypothetical protein